MVVEQFIEVLGRSALEAVLELSAEQVAGASHQGKTGPLAPVCHRRLQGPAEGH